MDDEEWEVRFHFLDRDNLERTICLSDITFWNLIALIEVEGYSSRDFMYYVRDPGVGVSGMEELTDDDKVEEMLDHIASKGKNVVNITVMRSDAPRPVDLNIGHAYEEQVPLSEIGVPVVYEVDNSGVLFPSPVKPQPQPVQVMHTHESSCLLKQKGPSEPEFALDNGNERHEYFMETDQEQEHIEQMMEQKRNEEIQRYRSNKIQREKYKAAKRKLPQLLAEEFTDSESEDEDLEDEDILARLEAMKRHRDDPLYHFEGDTDVEELYGPDEEEENEGRDEEEGQEEPLDEGLRGGSSVGGSSAGGSSSTGGSKRRGKGPTTRSHASLDQIIEQDWAPSSDEESNPGDLSQEENDCAQLPPFKLPNGRKSRAKKNKVRVWYDEKRENPQEQFVKKLCFLDVQQFRRALLTFHISQNRNYSFHRNCSDRVIVVCSTDDCPFFIAASKIAHEKTFCMKKMNLYHNCPAVGESTKVTARWLAHECEQQLRSDINTPVQAIMDNLKKKHGIEVSIHMAYRARKAAKEVVQGDQRAQYTRIRDYLQAVLDTNPGSRCIVTTKHLKLHPSKNPRFHGLFMCLNACKEGFLNGCRPFIGTCIIIFPTYLPLLLFMFGANVLCLVVGVDGCFVKLTTGQQILAATGRDGNNNIFPIAFAIVDKEDTASWSWFLTQLKYALGGESGKYGYYTIISDKQKVTHTP